MKSVFIAFILSIFLLTMVDSKSFAQSQDTLKLNQIINDSAAHGDILFGYCTYQGLSTATPFKIFWDIEYSSFQYNSVVLDSIKTSLKDISIKIVFGTWCDDSRMNVPRFIKILNYIGIDEKNVSMIGVDKKKKAGAINTETYSVLKVPTFIIYRNGIEIGRIIENPIISLEADLKNILMLN